MAPESIPGIFHYITGFLALLSAIGVLTSSSAVISAMCLMLTLFFTGGLFFAIGAPFVAAAQILIYAGAISVLFLFIVMLIDLKTVKVIIPGRRAVIGLGVIVSALLMAGIFANYRGGDVQVGMTQFAKAVEPKNIALTFLSKYMFPFQVTGFLILAAVVGVVVLGKPKQAIKNEGEV